MRTYTPALIIHFHFHFRFLKKLLSLYLLLMQWARPLVYICVYKRTNARLRVWRGSQEPDVINTNWNRLMFNVISCSHTAHWVNIADIIHGRPENMQLWLTYVCVWFLLLLVYLIFTIYAPKHGWKIFFRSNIFRHNASHIISWYIYLFICFADFACTQKFWK